VVQTTLGITKLISTTFFTSMTPSVNAIQPVLLQWLLGLSQNGLKRSMLLFRTSRGEIESRGGLESLELLRQLVHLSLA
jgi:hypothetical protein